MSAICYKNKYINHFQQSSFGINIYIHKITLDNADKDPSDLLIYID